MCYGSLLTSSHVCWERRDQQKEQSSPYPQRHLELILQAGFGRIQHFVFINCKTVRQELLKTRKKTLFPFQIKEPDATCNILYGLYNIPLKHLYWDYSWSNWSLNSNFSCLNIFFGVWDCWTAKQVIWKCQFILLGNFSTFSFYFALLISINHLIQK